MAAYEEERKNNIRMAGSIADAERRQADLQDNLNRICANPLYKLAVRVTTPVNRVIGRMKKTSLYDEMFRLDAPKEQRQA